MRLRERSSAPCSVRPCSRQTPARERATYSTMYPTKTRARRSAGEQLKEAEAKYLNVQGKLGGAAPACPVAWVLHSEIAMDVLRKPGERDFGRDRGQQHRHHDTGQDQQRVPAAAADRGIVGCQQRLELRLGQPDDVRTHGSDAARTTYAWLSSSACAAGRRT